MKIPVVLPVVHISVAAQGRLTVDVDGDPYEPASVFTRGDLGGVLDQITATLDSPVRVKVSEADGTTYTDLATPPDDQSVEQAVGVPDPENTTDAKRAGFHPGEEVALAYVLTRQTADAHGNASMSLPPALLASRRAGLVMVGLTSHVIADIQ